jgi:hypothetical protein
VGDAHHAGHEVHGPDVVDRGKVVQRVQPLHEAGTDVAAHPLGQALARHDLAVLERRGAGDGTATSGS